MKNLLKLEGEAFNLTDEYLKAASDLCQKHKLELTTDNLSMVLHWLGYFQQAMIQMSGIDGVFEAIQQAGNPDAEGDEDAEVTLEK